jgi:hypothetical protein
MMLIIYRSRPDIESAPLEEWAATWQPPQI